MTFNFNKNGKNNPQDMRNMILFVALAILIWFGFDHFIMKPRQDDMKRAATVAATTTPAVPEKIRPRSEIIAEGTRLPLNAPEVTGTIATTGIRFDDITLKNYYTTLEATERVVMLSPTGTEHPHYAEIGWLSDDTSVAVPGRTTVWTVKSQGDATLANPTVLTWDNGQGLTFERRISVDEHYMFTVAQSVVNAGAKEVTLYPYGSLARRNIPPHGKSGGFEGPMGYVNDQIEEISYKEVGKDGPINFTSPAGWIGFGEKYWLTSIIPDQKTNNTYRFLSIPNADPTKTLYQLDVRGNALVIPAGETASATTHMYVGAKRVKLLDSYENSLGIKHFDLAVDFGMFYFLTRPFYFLLNLFNSWVGNFGIAILMLTFLVRLCVFPLANKSYRSFAMLKKVSPRMAEIKIKYGKDKPRLQQELVKLYETERVNPMAGCFPLLLQIPIFFAVYKVISISIEMRHAPFYGWIHDLSERDPLSVFNLFGLLNYNVPAIMHIGPWSIAMLVLMLIQKRMNPPPQDPIQKDIANFMPWVITYTMSGFPSGLLIYWTFSNLISVVQQYVIMRMMGVPVYLFSPEKALEYEQLHASRVAEASERAKAEVGTDKPVIKQDVKDAEPVKESLFGDDTPPATDEKKPT